MTNKLKPCPFCGGKSFNMGDHYRYEVLCDCGCSGPHSRDEHIAVEKWNTRVESEIKPPVKCGPKRARVKAAQDADMPLGEYEDATRNAEIKIRISVLCAHWDRWQECPLWEAPVRAFVPKSPTLPCSHPHWSRHGECLYQDHPIECKHPRAIRDAIHLGYAVDEQGNEIDDQQTIESLLKEALK
jgi:Lar family restriction alleviation protein